MENSYNYSGFSSTLVMTRRRKEQKNSRTVVIQSADREEEDLDRFCPPYLSQVNKPKFEVKK